MIDKAASHAAGHAQALIEFAQQENATSVEGGSTREIDFKRLGPMSWNSIGCKQQGVAVIVAA
jgi:hypothetical protein